MPASYVVDMDGVIYHGHRLIPGALEFVERLRSGGHKFLFLTNNSQWTPRDLRHRLDQMGISGRGVRLPHLGPGDRRFPPPAEARRDRLRHRRRGADQCPLRRRLHPDRAQSRLRRRRRHAQLRLREDRARHPPDPRRGPVHRHQPRPDRPLRGRHPARLRRPGRADRAGHRPQALLRRQAEPADDAHRPAQARRPLGRGVHGRRPHGHRHHRRHRGRHAHHPRPLGRQHPRDDRDLPLSGPPTSSRTSARSRSTPSSKMETGPGVRGPRSEAGIDRSDTEAAPVLKEFDQDIVPRDEAIQGLRRLATAESFRTIRALLTESIMRAFQTALGGWSALGFRRPDRSPCGVWREAGRLESETRSTTAGQPRPSTPPE